MASERSCYNLELAWSRQLLVSILSPDRIKHKAQLRVASPSVADRFAWTNMRVAIVRNHGRTSPGTQKTNSANTINTENFKWYQ